MSDGVVHAYTGKAINTNSSVKVTNGLVSVIGDGGIAINASGLVDVTGGKVTATNGKAIGRSAATLRG